MTVDPITLADQQRKRAAQARRQMEWEHNRLYAALETTAQLAELAGHELLAAQLRRERHDVWAEVERGACAERPR